MYEVLSFVGDYPVEHQPYWDIKFQTIEDAKTAAIRQHNLLKEQCSDSSELYTLIIDDERDTEDEVMWITYKDQEYEELKAQEIADELAKGNPRWP